MNWDAIGAVAELLAAAGVVASLVYLATQMRQSREQMMQNTKAIEAQVAWAHLAYMYRVEYLHCYSALPGPLKRSITCRTASSLNWGVNHC